MWYVCTCVSYFVLFVFVVCVQKEREREKEGKLVGREVGMILEGPGEEKHDQTYVFAVVVVFKDTQIS